MTPPSDLRETVGVLVSTRPNRQQTGRFVHLCYRLAQTYLRQKQRNRQLNPSVLGLSMNDLAMDCIAELFERDAQGRFTQLVHYFNRLGWREADESALLSATRRLVFSVINDRVFQSYREVDASLSNIIRNLKRVISTTAGVTLERQGKTLWIHVDEDVAIGPHSGLRMPPEFLEAYLTTSIQQGTTTADLLNTAEQVFRAQTLYARSYPLTELARVFRSAWVRVHGAETEPFPEPTKLHREDITRLIENSVAAAQDKMRPSYVDNGKVCDDVFTSYFMAIRDRLTAEYVYNDGKDLTNYRALCDYLPGLSREAYGSIHRSIFEYLSKCAREQFVKQLQRET